MQTNKDDGVPRVLKSGKTVFIYVTLISCVGITIISLENALFLGQHGLRPPPPMFGNLQWTLPMPVTIAVQFLDTTVSVLDDTSSTLTTLTIATDAHEGDKVALP